MVNQWVRKAWAVAVALLLAVLLAGCAGSDQSTEMPGVEPAPAQDGGGKALPEQGTENGGADEDRMVIRSKTLRLEVESTADAVTKIRDLTREHNGTVTDMQVATDTDEWIYRYDERGAGDGTALRGWVTVRVPTDEYEEFVADVGELGTIKYQSEATDDVTQEHVDLSARLANMRAQEERLREFFDAAKNVTEMLAIEKELARVRGEVESLDAQVTYLERQASMATVAVELVEPRAVVRPQGDSWGFMQALTDGVRGAAQLLSIALTVLIASSPVWLAALILFFPVRAWLRRRRARTAPTVAEPAPAAPMPPPPPATSDDPRA